MIKLIASDIDATLLGPDGRLSPRTLAAVDAVRAAGLWFVPISGRQVHSIRLVLAGMELTGPVIGSNGAVGFDVPTRSVLFEELISVEAQTQLARAVKAEFPTVRFASVRDAGATFVPEIGYLGFMRAGDHGRDKASLVERALSEVLAEPSVKLVFRDPAMSTDALYRGSRTLGVDGCEVTVSGAPFVEVGPSGVSKATGLEQLCRILGVRQDEVVAFGDHHNDVDMLRWAGHGVAVGNALPEAKDAADEVIGTNAEDAVAVWIEELLAAQA